MTQQEEWCGDTLERRGDMVHVCTLPAHGAEVAHQHIWINKPWQQSPIPARPPAPEPPEPPKKPATNPPEPYVGPLFGNPDSVYRRMQGVLGGAGWIPPEDDRTSSPEPNQELPEGIEGQQQSKPNRKKPDKPQETPQTGGTAMASVAEVKAALDAGIEKVSEAQASLHNTMEILDEAQNLFMAALDGSGHEAVTSVGGYVELAKVEIVNNVMVQLQAGIENAQAYAAAL